MPPKDRYTALEHFPEKWTPVLRKEMRQRKDFYVIL